MSAFQHILLPLDFTSKNEAAANLTREIATPGKTRVLLLHVVESIAHSAGDSLHGFYEKLEQNAHEQLAAYSERFREANIDTVSRVAIGKPARQIVSEALTNGVDLIVVSSHPLGQNAGPTERWATVSYQVAIFCRCPVLLVK